MKEKLPGLFRPLMKFNVTAVMVIILMFSVFNVFSIVRTQQRQASLQTMALSQASQQIGDFIASAEQLGIVVQNDSQLMAYNLYNNRDLPHNIVWELEMLAPSVNSAASRKTSLWKWCMPRIMPISCPNSQAIPEAFCM